VPVRGLTLVLVTADRERFGAALTLACAQAAGGGAATVFLQDGAVAMLRPPIAAPADNARAAAGLPGLAATLEEAWGLGVRVIACQSGLALAGLAADALDPRIDYAGPVALLAGLGEDRLVVL
jgi:predicted peroxiredoxin